MHVIEPCGVHVGSPFWSGWGFLAGQFLPVLVGKGEFAWHTHAQTDELLIVVAGELTIQLRDGDVRLRADHLFVLP